MTFVQIFYLYTIKSRSRRAREIKSVFFLPQRFYYYQIDQKFYHSNEYYDRFSLLRNLSFNLCFNKRYSWTLKPINWWLLRVRAKKRRHNSITRLKFHNFHCSRTRFFFNNRQFFLIFMSKGNNENSWLLSIEKAHTRLLHSAPVSVGRLQWFFLFLQNIYRFMTFIQCAHSFYTILATISLVPDLFLSFIFVDTFCYHQIGEWGKNMMHRFNDKKTQ